MLNLAGCYVWDASFRSKVEILGRSRFEVFGSYLDLVFVF